MPDISQKLIEMDRSNEPDKAKLAFFANALADLKPIDNAKTMIECCDFGIKYATILNQPEMSAQLYITKAKIEIMMVGNYIYRMKNITLAPKWFQFSIESEAKEYAGLNDKVNKAWTAAQDYMNKGFDLINQNPIDGAVAFFLKTRGELYGQYYLQLRLYGMHSRTGLSSKMSNWFLFRWSNLDEFLLLPKDTRKKVWRAKKDCTRDLRKAIKIFKDMKNYEYMADGTLTLAFEYQSFIDPIRANYYLFKAKRLIDKYKVKGLDGNMALMKRHAYLENLAKKAKFGFKTSE